MTLSRAITPVQIGPDSNGNEGLLNIPTPQLEPRYLMV